MSSKPECCAQITVFAASVSPVSAREEGKREGTTTRLDPAHRTCSLPVIGRLGQARDDANRQRSRLVSQFVVFFFNELLSVMDSKEVSVQMT